MMFPGFLRRAGLTGAMLAAATAIAQPVGVATDLPPVEHVAVAIEQHPSVAGARAGITLEEANRRRLTAGPHARDGHCLRVPRCGVRGPLQQLVAHNGAARLHLRHA